MASSGYDGDGSDNMPLGRSIEVLPQSPAAERRSRKLDLIQMQNAPGYEHMVYANTAWRQIQGCTSPLVLSPKCASKMNHGVAPPPGVLQNGFHRPVVPPGELIEIDGPGHCISNVANEKQLRFHDEVTEREKVSCINWKCLCGKQKQEKKHVDTVSSPQKRIPNGNVVSKNGHDVVEDSVQQSAIHTQPTKGHSLALTQLSNGNSNKCGVTVSSPNHSCQDSGCGMLATPQHHNYFQFEYAYPSPDLSSIAMEDWCDAAGQVAVAPPSSLQDSAANTAQTKRSSAAILGKCVLKFGRKAPSSVRDPGSFSDPSSLDVFPNGDLAVLDSDNYTLQLFTQKGYCKKVYQFRRKIVDMVVLDHSSVALLREKDLGVFNIQEHAVRDINLPDCNNPIAMAKIQHSRYHVNYVVAMATYIIIYKGNGEILKKIQSHCVKKGSSQLKYHLVRITDISVHRRTKDIYVMDSGSRNIYVFSSKGSYKFTIDTTQFAIGAMSGLGKLCVDSAGNIALADCKNHRLLHYSQGVATNLMMYHTDYVPNSVLVTEDNKLVVAINSTGRSFAGVRVYNYRHQ